MNMSRNIIISKRDAKDVLPLILNTNQCYKFDQYLINNCFQSLDSLVEIAGYQTIIKIIIGIVFFLPIYGILLNLLSRKFIDSK